MTENGKQQVAMIHSLFFWFYCLVLIFLLIWFLFDNQADGKVIIAFMVIFPLTLALLHRKAKIWLLEGNGKGINLSIGLSIFMLFGFPIGTLAGLGMLAYLFQKSETSA